MSSVSSLGDNAAGLSGWKTKRFLIITVAVAAAHLLVTGFLVMSFWGSAMASFKRNTSTEAKGVASLHRIWNYGSCVAVEFYESRIAGPLPKFPREEFYEAPGLKEQYQRDRMKYYEAVQARGGIHRLLFLLWPMLVGFGVATVDALRRNRSPNKSV